MQSYEVYPTKEVEEKGRKISKNTDKTPEGKLTEIGEIVFENGDTIRHAFTKLSFSKMIKNNSEIFSGHFVNGRREGYCDITLKESRKEIIGIR